MSDDETKKPKVFLSKPPMKVIEMTDDEILAWVRPSVERLKPDDA